MMNKKYLEIFKEVIDKIDKSEDLNKKVLLIDGLNLYLRNFNANPTMNLNGVHVGGISGSLHSIAYTIRIINPARCIVVFDGKGGSLRRRKIYPEYKKGKKPSTRVFRKEIFLDYEGEMASMRRQMRRFLEYIKFLPVTPVSYENVEADDIIAYISTNVLDDHDIIICSTDKDFIQLVNNRISVWNPVRKVLYTPNSVYRDYNIPAHNFLLYRVIDGDKSDNIPGVKGIGLKTIHKYFPILLSENDISIDDLLCFASLNENGAAVYKKIIKHKDTLIKNKDLMQLGDVDISGTSKLLISKKILSDPIYELSKIKLQTLFLEDGLNVVFSNFNDWLKKSFGYLDVYAKIFNRNLNERI